MGNDKPKNENKNEKKPVNDGCVLPGCVDFFLLPLQIIILGHHFFNSI
ncbi:hypothetical protein [Metabacillus bambusae]|uniref:Uncharacterized protein n=1 Tax=Metabacillus bambusae TaxID=2795218 RepID=A0ABS3N136_9BACI|nr:hypothetical protein [Metabacillus bambusae]MBO1511865.1 hypothetical protein [Metabacillus bambusae]